MGSSPLCDRGFLCCAKPDINVPKSDLFVPHVSFKIKKKSSEKKKNKIIKNLYLMQKEKERSRSNDHRKNDLKQLRL